MLYELICMLRGPKVEKQRHIFEEDRIGWSNLCALEDPRRILFEGIALGWLNMSAPARHKKERTFVDLFQVLGVPTYMATGKCNFVLILYIDFLVFLLVWSSNIRLVCCFCYFRCHILELINEGEED